MTQVEARVRTLVAHPRPVKHVLFSHDSDIAITADLDGLVFVWRVKTGEMLRSYPGNGSAVDSIDISHDGSLLAICNRSESTIIYNILTGQQVAKIPHDPFYRGSIQFSIGGSRLLVVTNPPGSKKARPEMSKICVYDIANGCKEISSADILPHDRIVDAFFAPLDKAVMVLTETGSVLRVDTVSGDVLERIDLSDGTGIVFSFCPTVDRTGILVCIGQNVIVLNASPLRVVVTYKYDVPARAAALHPTKPLMVVAGGEDPKDAAISAVTSEGQFKVQFVDMRIRANLGHISGHRGTVHAVAFSHDGGSLMSSCEDSSVLLVRFPDMLESFQ